MDMDRGLMDMDRGMTDEPPTAETFCGTFARLMDGSDEYLKSHARGFLENNVNESKSDMMTKVKAMGRNAWIKFDDVEWVEKNGVGPDFMCDPFSAASTIAWRVRVYGRAFAVKRLVRSKPRKTFPHKNCVPKRKRGKPIPTRFKCSGSR